MDNTRKIRFLATIRQQQALTKRLRAHINYLKAHLAKRGDNSKPPSSDGLRKKLASLCERGRRSMGGPKGHAGKTLKLSARPDHVQDGVVMR